MELIPKFVVPVGVLKGKVAKFELYWIIIFRSNVDLLAGGGKWAPPTGVGLMVVLTASHNALWSSLAKKSRCKLCFRCAHCFFLPVWSPILTLRAVSGLCLMIKFVLTSCNMLRDILDISLAWFGPFRTGNPDTTMYASPIVST